MNTLKVGAAERIIIPNVDETIYRTGTVLLKDNSTRTVRALTTDDGAALSRFYASVPAEDQRFYCPHPLDAANANRVASMADDPCRLTLVMTDESNEIAGYAWCAWAAGAPQSVFGICIRRDHAGLGCGRLLMDRLIRIARRCGPPVMSLTVQKANPAAVHLYQKMGFAIVRDQFRDPDGEPEFLMELDLFRVSDSRNST